MEGRAPTRRTRWSRLLAGGLVLATAGGVAGFAAAQARQHLPTARVLVSVGTSVVPVHGSGQRFAEQVAASYAQVATTPLVLDPVIAELGLRTTSQGLAQRVASTRASGTMVIAITVAGGSRAESADIANAVSRRLVQTAGGLSPAGAATEVRLQQIAVADDTG